MMIRKIIARHNKTVHTILLLLVIVIFSGLFYIAYFNVPTIFSTSYELNEEDIIEEEYENEYVTTHVQTPEFVKAIYMSQCVVGTPNFREDLVEIAETTEINSIVIDIKDYTGKIGFTTENPILKDSISEKCGAYDIREFIESLHQKNIYVIGRITVFQDPFYSFEHPELAIKKASATSTIWTDYKGLSFIDAGARPFWDYIVTLSKESFDAGFDELNYDYIRFPSDGNMRDIYYPFSENIIISDPDYGKAEIIEMFFAHLSNELKSYTRKSKNINENVFVSSRPILSADLFGMVTVNTDDLNIGQVLERATPYFDFIAPMVYPSHYPENFNGWTNPNEHIYDVIKFSMDSAVERLETTTTTVKTLTNISLSTTTDLFSNKVYSRFKLRPWLQDFDYGGNYGVEEVRAQIQATYDAGLNSWMLWAPSNRYTIGALESSE